MNIQESKLLDCFGNIPLSELVNTETDREWDVALLLLKMQLADSKER